MASKIIVNGGADFRPKNVGGKGAESKGEVDEARAVLFGHPAGRKKGSFEGVKPVVERELLNEIQIAGGKKKLDMKIS